MNNRLRHRARIVPSLMLVGIALLPHAVAGQVTRFEGTLPTTPETDTVSARREHTFTVDANQQVEVRLTSSDFDTVLELIAPNGRELQNDDSGNGTDSFIRYSTSTAGQWRAIVTAFGTTGGDYTLTVSLGDPPMTRELPREALTAGDSVSAKGLRYKRYSFNLERRSAIAAEITSDAFRPAVILIGPDGTRHPGEGDDASQNIATAEVSSAEPGTWQVIATHSDSADGAEVTGPFSLIWMESIFDEPTFGEEGELSERDPQQVTGEYYHEYEVAVSGDAPLSIEVISDDFDGYLAVRSPSGTWYRNDDGDNGSNPSLTMDAAPGNWLVIVTTYLPDETGSYRLSSSRPAVRVRQR